jgi:micrococcal nuclease
MKPLSALLIALLVAIVHFFDRGDASLGLVTEVIDGDTIVVTTGDGKSEKVRYLLIDTPELHHPTRGEEELGKIAALENKTLVLGKKVRLEEDVERRDRYNRLLAYVWIEGPGGEVLVNEELVRRGVAMPFTLPPNVRYVERIHNAFREARDQQRGLWNAAAGRHFTGEQVWAELPALAGCFITLEFHPARVEKKGTRHLLLEEKGHTALVIYESDRPHLPPLDALASGKVVLVGKVQAGREGAEIILRDPIQIVTFGP